MDEKFSEGLEKAFESRGIDQSKLPPFVKDALKSTELWETFFSTSLGKAVIPIDSFGYRDSRTTIFAKKQSTPEFVDFAKRMGNAQIDAARSIISRLKKGEEGLLEAIAEYGVGSGQVGEELKRKFLLMAPETMTTIVDKAKKGDKTYVQELMPLARFLLSEPVEHSTNAANLFKSAFQDRGIPFPQDPETQKKQMAFTAGTSLQLHHAAIENALKNDAKAVLLPAGYFEPLAVIPYIYGGNVDVMPTHQSQYKLTADALKSQIEKHPVGHYACLVLTNPTNPNGSVYTQQELAEIGTVAVQNGIRIIVDEHFAGLDYVGDQKKRKSMQSLASITVDINGESVPLFNHSVTIQGTSKIYDYETSKLSVAISGDEEWMAGIKTSLRANYHLPTRGEVVDVPHIAATVNRIENRDRLPKRLNALLEYIENANEIAREGVFSLLQKPEAGFFAVITLPADLCRLSGINSHQDFLLCCLAHANVKGRTLHGMGIETPDVYGMRINFSSPNDEQLKEAFNRLSAMAKKMIAGELVLRETPEPPALADIRAKQMKILNPQTIK